MPDALPENPADPLVPNLASSLAPSTQRRLSFLDEVIDMTVTVMRMIGHETKQRFEASQSGVAPEDLPALVVAQDPAAAMEKLVALAEQLEHPPEPPTPRHTAHKPNQSANLGPIDLSRISPADLHTRISIEKALEVRERELVEHFESDQQRRFSPIIDMLSQICRTLGLRQVPKNQHWHGRLLLELTALAAFADEYKAAATPPNHASRTTVPPDD
jgi:hypothetical protein